MSSPENGSDKTTRFGTFIEPKTGSRPTVPQRQTIRRKDKSKPGSTTRRGVDALGSPSAKWLYQRRAGLIGLTFAEPAYSRPLWWLAGCAVILVLLYTGRLLKPAFAGGGLSPAALVVLPIRTVLAALGALPAVAGQLVLLLARASVCIALAVGAAGGTSLLIDAATNVSGCTAALEAIYRWSVPVGAYVAAAGFVARRLKGRPGSGGAGLVERTFDNTGEAGLLVLVGLAAVGAWLAYKIGWEVRIPNSTANVLNWDVRKSEFVSRFNIAVLNISCRI